MDEYIVKGCACGEITEKKSRFIGTVKECKNEEEALSFIESVRKKYWDARHNCYAYITGGENPVKRFSDDKEPQGTAGKPILNVLERACLFGACIVVTRYFGGILLGTGGLVRAYTQAAQAALEAAEILRLYRGYSLSITLSYKDAGKIEKIFRESGVFKAGTDYGEKIEITAACPAKAIEKLKAALLDATGGDALIGAFEEAKFYAEKETAHFID